MLLFQEETAMPKTLKPFAAAIAAALALVSFSSDAQVPPHKPGTICFTQQFWCWAQPPGTPRGPCSCQGPFGRVPGILG